MSLLGWDQVAPTLARRTGDSTRTKGSLVNPHLPPVHTKGVFSLQTQTSQCPCPSQASGSPWLARQGWETQRRAGGAGNAGQC